MTYLFKLYAKNSYVVSYLSVPEEKQHGLYNVKKKNEENIIYLLRCSLVISGTKEITLSKARKVGKN